MYMTQIRPNLFVGSEAAATDLKSLKRYHISAILNLDGPGQYYPVPTKCTFLHTYIQDGQPIPENLLYQILNFLTQQIQAGKNVLIHCAIGISRSPAIAIAYFLWTYPKMTWEQAYREVGAHLSISPAKELENSIKEFIENNRLNQSK